ncbi:MAG TPA: hypothetical protein VKB46_00180 [Pyrinomonadaceae bacterium]|nr:hypothetical protein [Pyrinomonadaceae bacterium]
MNKSKLVNVLIGKTILEVLLVSAVAVGFYLKAFPPFFHGWGEATPHTIAGWAVNNAAPWDRVQVQLFIDGKFITTGIANLSRPDVVAKGWARDEWCGFSFPPPSLSEGPHEARVFALHGSGGGVRYTLQLLGDPINFNVNADGSLTDMTKHSVRP